jgi:RNA polymerase sigma factor (sigma-70 family)
MSWTNEQMITGICGDRDARNRALQVVFNDEALRAFVWNYVGNDADAEEVFQDAVIIFDRNIRSGTFRSQSSWQTYFNGIAKWRWHDMRQRKDNQTVELKPELYDAPGESFEHALIAGERRQLLYQVIEQLREECRKVLPLYMLSYSMAEIAAETGSNAVNIRKTAERCRESFRQYLLDHPGLMKILGLKTTSA